MLLAYHLAQGLVRDSEGDAVLQPRKGVPVASGPKVEGCPLLEEGRPLICFGGSS